MRSKLAIALLAAGSLALGAATAAPGDPGGKHKSKDRGGKPSAYTTPVADPAGVIDLPKGYRYDVLTQSGTEPCEEKATSTESGAEVDMPADFDANVFVRGKGGKRWLLSAHELTQPREGDFQGDVGKCHVDEQATADDGDSDGWGSVTRMTLGKDGTTVTKREVITTGLHNLCAGALTPWGTFLVNEEFPFRADPEKRSGWAWEIDPATGKATRATGMGRLSHEQQALSRGAWWVTDDRGDHQYLYKFVADKKRDLSAGKLYGLDFDRSTNTGTWVGPLDPMDPEGDMATRVGPPDATNSFWKHEGIVKAKRGNGVIFAESASGTDPGRVWHLKERKGTVTGSVLVEGDFSKMSRPDNIRYNRRGDLFIFEDNGSALGRPETGGNNEAYVLPKGTKGAENLRKFATIRGGGEGTGPWFSRNGKLLYLSTQDQENADGAEVSRLLAIHVPKSHGRKHGEHRGGKHGERRGSKH